MKIILYPKNVSTVIILFSDSRPVINVCAAHCKYGSAATSRNAVGLGRASAPLHNRSGHRGVPDRRKFLSANLLKKFV